MEVRDLGGLLSSNGFSMLTIDTDDLKVVISYVLHSSHRIQSGLDWDL